MKMITTLIFLMLWQVLAAPPTNVLTLPLPEKLMPYEALWNATCKVESDFNRCAIGDRHLKNKSYGIAQIRKTRLDDYYKQTGIRYHVKDMFCPDKSKEVFMYYCNNSDLEVISRQWNGGIKGMNKRSTLKYWNKIQSEL